MDAGRYPVRHEHREHVLRLAKPIKKTGSRKSQASSADATPAIAPKKPGKKVAARKTAPKQATSKKVSPAASGKAPGKPSSARKQYGVVALKLRGDLVAVMLVTSRGTRRWIIPKGNPEKNKTGAEVAAIEAFEEAGLIGEVWNMPIGSYLAPKHLPSGKVVTVAIEVYRMDVDEVLDDARERPAGAGLVSVGRGRDAGG